MKQVTGSPRASHSDWAHAIQALGAVAFFATLTLIFTWPVSVHADRLLAGTPGDSVGSVWGIAWTHKALFQLHQSPLVAQTINYPEGWPLATYDISPATLIGAMPATVWFGPVAGFNFVALTSFGLSGLVVFLYVRRWTGSWLAGLFAGTGFAFSPFRISHYLVGHVGLLATQWPALYLLSMYDLTARRRVGWAGYVWPAAGLVLTALTSLYFLYMAVILSVAMLLPLLPWRRGIAAIGKAMAKPLAVWLLSFPLVALAILPTFAQLASVGAPTRSLSYLRMYSASPTDYILPPTFGLALGQWVGQHFERDLWVEATLYVGAVCLVVAVLGFMRRRREGLDAGGWAPWLVVLVLALVLSFGTDLNWLSEPVQVRVPDLLRPWHPEEWAFVPMPGRLALAWLPYYGGMRVWMRYGMFVGIAVCVLAGVALSRLLPARKPRTAVALGALTIAALIVDFAPRPLPSFEVRGEPIDYWLKEQTLPGAVAEFPYDLSDQFRMYRTIIHDKPLVNSPYATPGSAQIERIAPVLAGFPNAASIDVLADLGVTYVLVDLAEYPDPVALQEQVLALGLELGACRGQKCAYILSHAQD